MNEKVKHIAAGTDYFGDNRTLGISKIAFKTTNEITNKIFVLENTFHKKGGPAKHLHYDQDEWFYCIEGLFIFDIGNTKFKLESGDSILAPKKIPHVWAFVGNDIGKIIVAFSPAGMMESFFKEATKKDKMPTQDYELYHTHGMELLGPPMSIEEYV